MDEEWAVQSDESLEVSAKTVDEAIAKALAQLGLRPDQVHISILSEGSRGFLGMGAEDARILVTPHADALATEEPGGGDEWEEEEELIPSADTLAEAKEVVQHLLRRMRVNATVVLRPSTPESPPALDIRGDDLGLLIGRRGETLAALQFITNLILHKRLRRRVRVVVDVAGYRLRREQTLREMAQRMAERAWRAQQPVTLEPMPPNERRIVHLALAEHPYVTTQSIGEEGERRVVIVPQRQL
jgi:spoIIIJ-associated protein